MLNPNIDPQNREGGEIDGFFFSQKKKPSRKSSRKILGSMFPLNLKYYIIVPYLTSCSAEIEKKYLPSATQLYLTCVYSIFYKFFSVLNRSS